MSRKGKSSAVFWASAAAYQAGKRRGAKSNGGVGFWGALITGGIVLGLAVAYWHIIIPVVLLIIAAILWARDDEVRHPWDNDAEKH